jgi:hypothetical protein
MTPRTIPAVNLIEDAVRDVPGWSPLDQLFALFTLAWSSADLPGDIVELGSWCGRSGVALGLAAQLTGQGRVHCVDLFPARDDWFRNADGSWSFRVTIDGRTLTSYDEQTVWAEPFASDIAPLYAKWEHLYDAFMDTVRRSGLEAEIVPFRGDLEMFLAQAPADFRCRLAFLDGHHGYEAVCRDIAAVESCLVPGGWICFDDAFTSYEGVNRAIEERILANPAFDHCQQLTRKLFVARRRPVV